MPIHPINYCSDKQISKLVFLGFGTTALPDDIPIASAFQWLREEMEIHVEIYYNNLFPKRRMNRWSFNITMMTKERPCNADLGRMGFKTYSKAESVALDDALQSLKESI